MEKLNYASLPTADRYAGTGAGEIEVLAAPDAPLPISFANKYLVVLEDPVRFPDGQTSTYLRLFSRPELTGEHGTVMLARWEGKYVLLRLFRHPTRSWELECPRGFGEPGCSPEDNARREVREELGVAAVRLERLGETCPNTGLLATRAHVFLAELSAAPGAGGTDRLAEAIGEYILVERDELLRLIAEGKIRDAFTLSAVLLALTRQRL